ncbi:branched-chain amino acid ABC transporter substrate-binding protein [Chitinimonas arctica]|uniref:Branched-chain amino acid ABC transporter substrate-binding protein n=1 Tax=Chitinimonas arctica TaxID=2594795 RepID=A0A516SEF1_9NEIS|nr:branched-chain amino acid ABC transporter substrate-binding protein [Chitinimonas arctica]QDQ26531.1 branched-chain amino acid ABC transporter substrate-binding protein [Chitinimonas arctica]
MPHATLRRSSLVIATAYLALTAHAAPPQVVKLGFAAPLTGPQAHYGADMKAGIVLALEDVNKQAPVIAGKSVKFELLAEDDQADPKTATSVAQRFVDQKVSGVIGHFNSGTSIPASRIYADAGIPQIAMATAPAFTAQGFKTTFRAMTSDTQQGSVMGGFVVKKLGLKKVAIIDDRTAYGQGLADQFELAAKAAGGVIVQREYTNDKATDFASILTSIRAKQPDVIFYGGADTQSAPLTLQMRRLGMKAQLVSGEMTRTDNYLKLAGNAADGVIASLAGLPMEKTPGSAALVARVKARFGAADFYAPYSYDATMVMVQAMQAANSTEPARYLPFLAKTRYSGATSAEIAYDARGDLKHGDITVYRADKGKWSVMETVSGI